MKYIKRFGVLTLLIVLFLAAGCATTVKLRPHPAQTATLLPAVTHSPSPPSNETQAAQPVCLSAGDCTPAQQLAYGASLHVTLNPGSVIGCLGSGTCSPGEQQGIAALMNGQVNPLNG